MSPTLKAISLPDRAAGTPRSGQPPSGQGQPFYHVAPRPALAGVGRTLAATLAPLGAAIVCAVVGTTFQPEPWSAGAGFVLRAAGAWAFASAGLLLAVGAGAAGWASAASAVQSGEATASAALGRAPRQMLVAHWPAIGMATALAVSASGWIEPAGWRELHAVRGGPATAAAFWGAIGRGEARALRDGTTVQAAGDRLRLRGPGGTVLGEAGTVEPAGAVWRLSDLRVSTPDGRWTVGALALSPQSEPPPPRSPWTRSPLRLLAEGADSGRARLVLARRLGGIVLPGLMFAACYLGALGRGRAASLVGILAAIPLAARIGERGAAANLVDGAVGGALPLLVAVVALGLMARRQPWGR